MFELRMEMSPRQKKRTAGLRAMLRRLPQRMQYEVYAEYTRASFCSGSDQSGRRYSPREQERIHLRIESEGIGPNLFITGEAGRTPWQADDLYESYWYEINMASRTRVLADPDAPAYRPKPAQRPSRRARRGMR